MGRIVESEGSITPLWVWYYGVQRKRKNQAGISCVMGHARCKGHEEVNGEGNGNSAANDLNQIDDAEEIRDHMLRAIYGSANAGENFMEMRPGNRMGFIL
jgi:hypothetical protein